MAGIPALKYYFRMRKILLLLALLSTPGMAQDSHATSPVDSLALLREALANHKAYIKNRVAIGKGYHNYYDIQGREASWGMFPTKEIELAHAIGSKTEARFRTARALYWISVPALVIGYWMFFYYSLYERSYITFYEGDRKYRGSGVPEDRDAVITIGVVVGLAGFIGGATAFQIHKNALYDLDRDLRKRYGVD